MSLKLTVTEQKEAAHKGSIDASSLQNKGIWPIFLSSALLEEQKQSAAQRGLYPYLFSLNVQDQLMEWKKQLYACAMEKNCQILWAVKGGYGATRLPSVFDLEEFRELFKNKIFIGYSDLTVIHQIYASLSWPSIHGALLAESFDETKCRENIDDVLAISRRSFAGYQVGQWKRLTRGSKTQSVFPKGQITGGNLSILQCGIGTSWLNLRSYSYLFIEDIHLKPYQLDRILWHLYQAEQLQHFQAIFVGDLGFPIEQGLDILLSWEKRLQCPFFYDPRFGHGRRNIPLLFHQDCHLELYDTESYQIIY